MHYSVCIKWDVETYLLIRAVKQLFSLIALIVRLIFYRTLIAVLTHILLVTYVLHLQVDVVGPLLLNATLLLVLTTDYSDWLVQVDVVGPLLLNASLLLVLTTDYSDWLVQVDVVSPSPLNASLLLVLTTDYSDWLVQVDVVGPLLLNQR